MTFDQDIVIKSVERAKWPAIAALFADYNFEQSPDYAVAMASRAGASARFFAVRRGTRLIGGTSVRVKTLPMLDRGLAYLSGGPMTQFHNGSGDNGQTKTVLAALKQELVEEEGHLLLVRLPIAPPAGPGVEMAFSDLGFRPTRLARSYRTIVIDLSPDPDTLRRKLAGKWRTDLNFAQKQGLTIEQGGGKVAVERFLALFGTMRDTKNFDVYVDPHLFFNLPANGIGLEVLIATKDGRDAAGHVISMLGDSAVYLFGATNELGRAMKAGYLLNWHAMLLAKERGFAWYDLGGIDPDANPGGHRFKKRMGGCELTAIGPYEARPNDLVGQLVDGLLTIRNRFHSRKDRSVAPGR